MSRTHAAALIGGVAWAIRGGRSEGVVFLYHRVGSEPDPAYAPLSPWVFEEHCRWICANFIVLPLRELVARLHSGRSLKRCCAVTFDDGFRDFATSALPILSKYQMPVTHFLVADCLLTGRPTWNYRLNLVLQAEKSLGSAATDHRAMEKELARLKETLGRMEAPQRSDWLEEREWRCGISFDRELMLRPEQICQLDPELVTWGSHTLSHASLEFCDEIATREELRRSRDQLQQITGSTVDFLSYPNNSYSSETMKIAAAQGYSAAFAVHDRPVRAAVDAFEIPRFDVGALDRARLRMDVSGITGLLRNARSHLLHA